MVGTTPKIQAIGAELRRAREAAGMSARQLAAKLGKAHTTITRWESGDRTPRAVDIATVLSALGASNELREDLVSLTEDGFGPHWTAMSRSEEQRQLATILAIEREATRVTVVSPLLVPGILQTSDYARAIMTAASQLPRHEIDMRVAMRVGRRDILLKEDPAQLLAITSEHVFDQLIGGPQVMAAQLRALESYASLPNVTLRVIPNRTGWHPGLEGAFSVRECKGRNAVVSVENRLGSQCFHEPDHVLTFTDAVTTIAEAALSAEESVELLNSVRKRMENRP